MNEPQRKVLLVRSAPSAPETASALDLASALRAAGHSATLVLIQDAVLCAVGASALAAAQRVRELLADLAACYYLAPDLAMRGYGLADVADGCEPLDYPGLVDVLLADGVSVAGAF